MQIVGYDTGTPPGRNDPAAVPTDRPDDGSHLDGPPADGDAGEGTTIPTPDRPVEARPPALLVVEAGSVDRVPLEPGAELAYDLGERRCAGAVDGTDHHACDRDDAPRCDGHTSTWVCARCTGTCLKDEMDCHDRHVVYLAGFAPATVKVGVTRAWRFRVRLREQGADRAAHLRTVSNGRIAREIEAEIATDLPDRVRVPTKIAGLGRPVDETAWERVVAAHDAVGTYRFAYGLDLSARPVRETIATGTVRGVKGRVLVLDRAGGTYAVDLRALVGHEVAEGGDDRSLQSNLGAFS